MRKEANYYRRRSYLTQHEQILVKLLLSRAGCVSREAITSHLYGYGGPDQPDTVLKILICHIRTVLRQVGIDGAIGTVRGVGYCINPEKRDAVAAFIGAATASPNYLTKQQSELRS